MQCLLTPGAVCVHANQPCCARRLSWDRKPSAIPLSRSTENLYIQTYSFIRNETMPITQLKWKPLDKLFMLWTICLIAHRRERQESIAYGAIKQDFSDDIADLFHVYCAAAIDQKLLNWETMQLTNKGITASQNWQQINSKLYCFF